MLYAMCQHRGTHTDRYPAWDAHVCSTVDGFTAAADPCPAAVQRHSLLISHHDDLKICGQGAACVHTASCAVAVKCTARHAGGPQHDTAQHGCAHLRECPLQQPAPHLLTASLPVVLQQPGPACALLMSRAGAVAWGSGPSACSNGTTCRAASLRAGCMHLP